MVWKKSFISIIIYVLYFLGISSALVYYVFRAAAKWGQGMDLTLVITCGFMVGLLLLFLLFRLVRKRLSKTVLSRDCEWAGIAEGILFIALITAGLVLRIMNLNHAGESAAYYEAAKVTANGGIAEVTHGATFFYVYLLRFLFLIVGNKWIAGIWLQMVLQILAGILLYVSVRRVVGAAAGLTLLGMMMFLPTEITRGLTYTPHVFFLVIYALAFLSVAFFLDHQIHGHKNSWSKGILIVITAACIGLTCYLDVMGLTLFVPVLFGLHVKRENGTWQKTAISVLILVVLSILFWAGCLCLDAYVCQKSFLDIFYAWLDVYRVKDQDMWFWYAEKEQLTGLVALGFMVFGAFSFWVSGKFQRYIVWIVMLLCVCVMEYFHIPVNNMDGKMFLLIIGGALSGVGIQEGISSRKAVDIIEKEAVGEVPETEGGRKEDNTWEMASDQKGSEPAVQLIDNPLPLPKKHVKKELNYKVQPQDEMMCFDIEVSENDDFDL